MKPAELKSSLIWNCKHRWFKPFKKLVGVHGSGWIGLREFFDPTHHGGLKKIQPITGVQPNPTQPTWIRLGWVKPMGWTIFIIITIIIKLNKNIYLTYHLI